MELVLASQSPRRRALLEHAGLRFKVRAAHGVDESPVPGESPERLAVRLASQKATEVSKRFKHDLVLGCDTIVVSAGQVLGKPVNREEARSMLLRLSNRTHRVMTGLAWVRGGRCVRAERVETDVTFSPIPVSELDRYLSTDEAYDKAGAYGIQGTAGRWVKGLEGDYFNVVGLPVARVLQYLWSTNQ
jgi:septum formation protein